MRNVRWFWTHVPPAEFAKGFIPNSVSIGLDSNFAMWVGEMIPDIKQTILLVTEPGKEEESIIRLSRVGYDNTIGYLQGGFEAWKAAGKEVDRGPHQFRGVRQALSEKAFDHRCAQEERIRQRACRGCHQRTVERDQSASVASSRRTSLSSCTCQGGYRSMIAASILKQRGWENFVDVVGGFSAIKETDVKRTEYVCPSTLL